ncbi:hypothetical protein LSH36_532g05014 [Paralvinella palmiformis]|uniref:DUF4110 domain-containing protein n=1 Tax=Paralvinella palmiformis TaxID=53620 RepID=A0AAD9J725_9ANNE|nr:hypothetical protein LSH36_532g05014 [Paralvinella palmiformis]
MGKKKGKDKKGKGAEKTFQKTDRKAERKLKKELTETRREFQEQDRKRVEVTEEKCEPPSPRCNMSFVAHPDKDELVMFGGEYFNGKQTMLYNDLYYYNIKNNDWTLIKSPEGPPPRCAHQAVVVSQAGGQMWVFGGEFASSSQSQFYHYKDLWMYSFKEKRWQKINAPGGPSARSGHRMVACKKLLLVFGGFHDNIRDYKYFNDLYAFSLETYTWIKLEVSGTPPLPRSGCIFLASQDQNHVTVYGGYSKERIKKDVDKGKTHTDMFMLSVDSRCKHDSVPTKWKWVSMKQSGCQPSPRCGCSAVVVPGNRALVFGGVFDEIEDDETVQGIFYNDIYSLELDKAKWHEIILRGKKDSALKKKRRKKKRSQDGTGDKDEEESEDDEEAMEEELEELTVSDEDNMEVQECEETSPALSGECSKSDDVFTVTVSSETDPKADPESQSEMLNNQELFIPGVRMNTLLAMKHGILYMFGGIYEAGDKQYTLSDMYSLDLHKLDQWNTIVACDLDLLDWQESDESSEEDEADGDEGEMDSDSEDDDDDEEDMDTAPPINEGESLDDYYQRTAAHWLTQATDVANEEGLQVSEKQLKKAASRMAKDYYKEHQST